MIGGKSYEVRAFTAAERLAIRRQALADLEMVRAGLLEMLAKTPVEDERGRKRLSAVLRRNEQLREGLSRE